MTKSLELLEAELDSALNSNSETAHDQAIAYVREHIAATQAYVTDLETKLETALSDLANAGKANSDLQNEVANLRNQLDAYSVKVEK